MGKKTCSKCNLFKSFSEFDKDSSKKDGLYSSCKNCNKLIKKKYRKKNKKKIEQYHKNRYISVRKTPKLTMKEKQEKQNIYSKKYDKTPKKRYYIYKHSAIRKKISFELTFEEFMLFWNNECVYCNEKIKTIGIDRIDNTKGYQEGNIQPCCTTCNSMKSNKTEADFLNHCKKIINHVKQKHR